MKTRKCPQCGKKLHYSSRSNYSNYYRAVKNNCVCRSCSVSNTKQGTHLSNKTKRKMSAAHLHSLGTYGMKGKHHSAETRQKMRYARLGKGKCWFNPVACQRIDEYGKKHGFNFQHALNGGEIAVIGYSVDGYDKDKNVVIEYYEKHHRRKIERDEHRKQEIINHLGCKFIELKEW